MNPRRLALLVLVTACAAPALDDVAEAARAGQATIHGKVFFNDRRQDGLFTARRDPAGHVGTRCNPAGQRDDGSACSENWLAAQYAVAKVIDGCSGATLTSVAVAYDASFAASFTPTGCAVYLDVVLRFCGSDWCFSMNSDEDTPYHLYYPGASPSAPVRVCAGDSITLGDMHFNPAGSSPSTPNPTAIAASYYASLVDAVMTVNRDHGIPFYEDEYGELEYLYPSTRSSTATTLSATRVVISTFEDGWPDGRTPAHEYGHVLMLRAWDGDYGFDGVGISCNDVDECPSQQIAFKEAWAQFIFHAVMVESFPCDATRFDPNDEGYDLPGALGDGTHWRLNVTKALCDWYDGHPDDDPTRAGAGDHFSADLYSMWFDMKEMYETADQYGGEYQSPGLYFCDWVDYYLNVRKSAAAVGQAAHRAYVDAVVDLIYENDLACFYPAPG